MLELTNNVERITEAAPDQAEVIAVAHRGGGRGKRGAVLYDDGTGYVAAVVEWDDGTPKAYDKTYHGYRYADARGRIVARTLAWEAFRRRAGLDRVE